MNSFFKKLIRNYRVIIFTKESLKEVGSFSVNQLYILGVFLFCFIICFCISLLLVGLSPLGGALFDYSKKSELSKLYLHVDSIESLVDKQLNYTENLKLILNNSSPKSNKNHEEVVFSLKNLDIDISQKDSLLTTYIKSLSVEKIREYNKNLLARLNISRPIKGMVTSSFNLDNEHFGVDIAAEENTEIKSVLSGAVVFSGFSENFGNYLIINHPNDFCSIYLQQGDIINSGDVVALVGSTGRLSSAPHLHFELWSGTIPIDPEKYIDFY